MWKNALVAPPPGGRSAVGQAGMGGHIQASVAAHAAAARAHASKALGASGHPPAGNFKQHIANTLSAGGVPTNVGDVHQAIGAMTQAGHFTPQQGQGLMTHNGPLAGPQGLDTMAKIGHVVAAMKQPRPMPGGMPQAPGGMPGV